MSDDPEIVLGGGGSADPAPSAPPASFTSGLPSAVGTPVMATATATAPPATATIATPLGTTTVTPTTPNTTSAGGVIDRTINDDGSLTVKITTTTPQPNGYLEVKIEYFTIPQGVAHVVQMSLDQGDPPSRLYMTKMEQQTLPPGTGTVMSRPPAYDMGNETAPLAPEGGGAGVAGNQDYMNPVNQTHGSDGMRACGICCGIGCIIFVVVGIIGGATSSKSSHSQNSSPSWPSYSPPSPSWPSYTPPSPSWPSYTPPSPYYPSWTPAPVYRPWWELPTTPPPTISSPPTRSPYPSVAPSSSMLPTRSTAPSDVPTISSQPSTSPPTMAPFAFSKFTLHPIFRDWPFTPPPNLDPSRPTTPAASSAVQAPVYYADASNVELDENGIENTKDDGNASENDTSMKLIPRREDVAVA